MRFNINENVKVRLTDYGRRLHKENWSRLVAMAGRPKGWDYSPPKEDAEGWSEWQLWTLMQELGPHIHMGGDNPFDLEIEIVCKQTEAAQ